MKSAFVGAFDRDFDFIFLEDHIRRKLIDEHRPVIRIHFIHFRIDVHCPLCCFRLLVKFTALIKVDIPVMRVSVCCV